jgi:hypothetical protein
MSERFSVSEIVDCDEFDLRIVQSGANDLAAYAAEAVDTYFHGHGTGVLSLRGKTDLLGLNLRIPKGG